MKTPISPTTETIVSITDQVLRVSLNDKLKYSLNIQKPGSFTCENIRLPAPVANTMRLGFTPVVAINGATIPAVVKPATVADPKQTRIIAAMLHAANNGCTFIPCNPCAIWLLIPVSVNICFKPPAPPIINNHGNIFYCICKRQHHLFHFFSSLQT